LPRFPFPECGEEQQEEAMKHLQHATLALALLAGSGAARAQTTIVTPAPVQRDTVVTAPAPVELTPVQRQTIYRTIVRAPVTRAPAAVEYRVGTPVPRSVHLYPMPHDVVVQVPAVRTYRYMVVNHQVVLVDPATSQVVAELGD
jgi:Protein of unknown function (DUF1236)